MNQWIRRLELPIVAALFIAGSAFLFKLAYLPLLVSTALGILFLLAFYLYVRQRYDVKVPIVLLLLVQAGIEVDALGNYFRLYGGPFGPMQYDEFAHFAVQLCVAPIVVWLLREGIERFGYRLPLGLITFFSITILFSLSGFYEILELWDDKSHPAPGMRIHGPYDSPNDLQCDLAGIVLGAMLTYAVMKSRARSMPQGARAVRA
jgi:uncharacterized membrane protein YjdF